jgi:hypothetical protein
MEDTVVDCFGSYFSQASSRRTADVGFQTGKQSAIALPFDRFADEEHTNDVLNEC